MAVVLVDRDSTHHARLAVTGDGTIEVVGAGGVKGAAGGTIGGFAGGNVQEVGAFFICPDEVVFQGAITGDGDVQGFTGGGGNSSRFPLQGRQPFNRNVAGCAFGGFFHVRARIGFRRGVGGGCYGVSTCVRAGFVRGGRGTGGDCHDQQHQQGNKGYFFHSLYPHFSVCLFLVLRLLSAVTSANGTPFVQKFKPKVIYAMVKNDERHALKRYLFV
jgi:hypothetical protein